MIKGLIITHGDLGKELISIAESILEEKVDTECISLEWEEDGTRIMNKIEAYLNKNKENKVIIFTDMFGGSPTNISFKFNNPDIEIITGINLPGFLKYLTYKNKNLSFQEIVKTIKKGAMDGINIISEYLGEKKG